MAKVVDGGGKVVEAKLFTGEAPVAKTDDPATAAEGIDAAFVKAATDLIVWALAAINEADAAGMPAPPPAPAAPKQPAPAQ
jgi:hypothetical protein